MLLLREVNVGQTELQVIIGFIMPFVLQMLKRASWFPLLTERTDKIIKIAWSAVVAAGSALAISFAFDPTLGQLTVTGLTWGNLGNGLLAFAVSMISQQVSYRTLLKPKEPDNG
jgi:hypothetical protein